MSSVLIKDTQGKKAVPLDAQLLSERDVYLTGEINEEMLTNFHGRMLTLKRADGEKNVRVWLTSGGGDVVVALAIIDIISTIGLNIDVIGYSSVYSAGALILAGGQNKRRYCLPNTEIMIHQISIKNLSGSYSAVKNQTDNLLQVNYRVNRLLSEKTKKSIKEIEKMCSYDHFMFPKEAKKLRIVDEIKTIAELIGE